MCVIAICEHARLTDEQVNQMWDANPRGGGAAWREMRDGVPVVKWEKGILKENMIRLNRELPLPYVLHFRVPSTGTSQSYLACHPFQIDEVATSGFDGEARPRVGDPDELETTGYVLFHNGFWHNWKEKLQTISMNGTLRLPAGPWSDSRGLAWATHHLGFGFLELVDEKVVAFGPGDYDIEVFGGWSVIENLDEAGNKQNILVSNKTWEKSYTAYNSGGNTGGGRNSGSGGTGAGGTGGNTGSSSSQTTAVLVTDRRNPNLQQLASGAPQSGGAAASLAATFRSETGSTGSAAEGREADQQAISQADENAGGGNVETHDRSVEAGSLNKKCPGCQKPLKKGNILNGVWFCWHCWAERTQNINNSKPFMGMCFTCKASQSSAKVVETDRWMCDTCWRTNGKPRVKFMLKTGDQVHSLET